MKPSTLKEIVGRLDQVRAQSKEKVGRMTNIPQFEAEDLSEVMAGKEEIGHVGKVMENARADCVPDDRTANTIALWSSDLATMGGKS